MNCYLPTYIYKNKLQSLNTLQFVIYVLKQAQKSILSKRKYAQEPFVCQAA